MPILPRRSSSRRPVPSALLLVLALALLVSPALTAIAEEDGDESSPVVSTDPEDGAVLSRPARSLRVWFEETPAVETSSLALTGPAGDLEVTGLHTMGENDLMARVVGPMPDGEYTATWRIRQEDGDEVEGTWTFEIQRGGR